MRSHGSEQAPYPMTGVFTKGNKHTHGERQSIGEQPREDEGKTKEKQLQAKGRQALPGDQEEATRDSSPEREAARPCQQAGGLVAFRT